MKKIGFCILLATIMVSGCQTSKPTLKVFSWGAYIDDNVISRFEKENNCIVIYDMFESNEAMYTKLLSQESYDVLVPSDYMVQRLIQEELLRPLDHSLISNESGIINALLNQEFDPNNTYSLPYFWGNVGLMYNTKNVSIDDITSEGWEILRDTEYKGKIYFYDSERDAFMVALKALGYSTNTTSSVQLEKAFEWLKVLDNTMAPVYAADDIIDNMIQGNKDIAMVYSGDAAYIISQNPDMAYYVPKQGTNLWIDNMVISKKTKEITLANQWINYMLDPEIATLNSEFVGYSSPIQSVYDDLAQTVFAGNNAYTPRIDYRLDEVFKYDETVKRIISEQWLKIKAQ
jgi:spermidine/putrescine transport system permease protein